MAQGPFGGPRIKGIGPFAQSGAVDDRFGLKGEEFESGVSYFVVVRGPATDTYDDALTFTLQEMNDAERGFEFVMEDAVMENQHYIGSFAVKRSGGVTAM